jgi:hypothetical protein
MQTGMCATCTCTAYTSFGWLLFDEHHYCYGCSAHPAPIFAAAAACTTSSTYPRFPHNLRCLTGLVISDSHFLRVSFGDEHGDRLFSSKQEPVEEFYRLMGDVLHEGEPELPTRWQSVGASRTCSAPAAAICL